VGAAGVEIFTFDEYKGIELVEWSLIICWTTVYETSWWRQLSGAAGAVWG
jgi:hypothetical protein